MRMRTMAFVAMAVLAPSGAVRAQGPESITVTVGAGAGWMRVSCDICQTSRDFGPSVLVDAGKFVRPGLRAAGEALVWTQQVESEREVLGALLASLYVHPREGPLYLKGGLGYVGYRAGEEISMNALGLQVGTGYRFELGTLALHGYANLLGSSFGSLQSEGTTIVPDVSATLLQFGVGVTLR